MKYLQPIKLLFDILVENIIIIKKQEMICKRQGHHDPSDDMIQKYVQTSKPVDTLCLSCGCALQLCEHPDDSGMFLVCEV